MIEPLPHIFLPSGGTFRALHYRWVRRRCRTRRCWAVRSGRYLGLRGSRRALSVDRFIVAFANIRIHLSPFLLVHGRFGFENARFEAVWNRLFRHASDIIGKIECGASEKVVNVVSTSFGSKVQRLGKFFRAIGFVYVDEFDCRREECTTRYWMLNLVRRLIPERQRDPFAAKLEDNLTGILVGTAKLFTLVDIIRCSFGCRNLR
jgi:hypothetical protein